jgi:predicted ATPase with chaperone activity
VRDFRTVDDSGPGAPWALLRAAMQQLQMSARAYHRIIMKLARTIADLAGSEWIETVHLAARSCLAALGT